MEEMISHVRDSTPIQILGTVTVFRKPLNSKYVNAKEQEHKDRCIILNKNWTQSDIVESFTCFGGNAFVFPVHPQVKVFDGPVAKQSVCPDL